MTSFVPVRARAPRRRVAMRFAWRELRGGMRGFYVFIACIALGVMAIAGVGGLASSLTNGLAREGRVILGGDVAFSLIHREATAQERAFLAGKGEISVTATMRAMARGPDGRTALVELKAVDAAYPMVDTVLMEPDMPLGQALAARDGVFGAVVDPALLLRFGLAAGARITVGAATFELRAELRREPDKLASGIGFGPRMLIGIDGLRATGLLQPGSLVRWHYRLLLPPGAATDADAERVVKEARAALPDAGWRIRTRRNASPQLERNVNRFSQFLTLVGLTALLVGGVGVANAVKSHLDRRREVIATMKTLGATGGDVFTVYLTQVMLLALAGSLIGLIIGGALPFVVDYSLSAMIPLPIEPDLRVGNLALALLYGLLTALAFSLWPLGRAHDVPVSELFRDPVEPAPQRPRLSHAIATVVVVAALASLAVALAYERRIAAIFVAAAAAVFLALWAVARLVMAAAARLPRARNTVVRLAVANIHRPGALTRTVVLSLGLGLALLVTVIQVDGNLRRQFMAALPNNAPSFYFVDIQSADAERFDAFVRARAPEAELERVPMLRGRIVEAKGIRAEDLKPAPHAAWVLQSDRGITYTGMVPQGSRVVAGTWWGENYSGPPLVSFENKLAEGLGLSVGDTITVNVLGRNITATIANLRAVDWQNLGINFVLVFSPNSFRGAPHTHIATLTYPKGGGGAAEETALLRAVVDAFPSVTVVRVKDALEAVGRLVANLVLGLRGASLVTLLAAVLVLGGALAAGHRHRVYDAVILKTLGATRARLLAAYGLEYLLLGLATAVFGVAAGSVAAWFVLTEVMNLTFAWLPGPAAAAAFGALLVTVLLGLIGTFTALGQKPAPVLRNL